MNRSRKNPRKKYSETPEWRLEQIQTHINKAIRHNHELCNTFGLLETDLSAILKRARKIASDYLYVLETETLEEPETQETLLEDI
ncbi:unnamed protein product [marine sediment metagenome]|uniref:Uncharacterized protein n=1 Tax=marine sediment metagenome TaxID=412755 RepID=X1G4P1_9ZZZZ